MLSSGVRWGGCCDSRRHHDPGSDGRCCGPRGNGSRLRQRNIAVMVRRFCASGGFALAETVRGTSLAARTASAPMKMSLEADCEVLFDAEQEMPCCADAISTRIEADPCQELLRAVTGAVGHRQNHT